MSSASNTPPAPNPFVTSFRSHYNATPLVTRLILSSAFATYISSLFFIDLSPYVASSVTVTVFSLQIHRLILSPLVCSSIISLVFSCLRFLDNGKRIEHSTGSTNFASLLLSFTILTNTLHIIICFVLYNMSGEEIILSESLSVGVWNLVLAVTAMECSTADASSKTRLLMFSIPTRYYPFFLLLINGVSLSHCISLAVGYLSGGGKLEFIKLNTETKMRLENSSLLQNFTTMEGFMPGPNISSGTWSISYPSADENTENGSIPGGFGSGFWNNPMSQDNNNSGSQSSSGWTPTVFRKPAEDEAGEKSIRGQRLQGHRLGTATLRSNAHVYDNAENGRSGNSSGENTIDRSKLLAAAERRAARTFTRSNNIQHDEEKGAI